jgi:hypothetical protein
VKTTAAEIIEGAIAAYRGDWRSHDVKNPAAFFVHAIRNALDNCWTSDQANFCCWFKAMRKVSQLSLDQKVDRDYLVQDGQYFVFWMILVKRVWTCKYLQECLRQ